MATDEPIVEIFFVMGFFYSKLRVFKGDEVLARQVLEYSQVEFLTGDESEKWIEMNTAEFLRLVKKSLPRILGTSISNAITEALSPSEK
jgi:hypothetical protein